MIDFVVRTRSTLCQLGGLYTLCKLHGPELIQEACFDHEFGNILSCLWLRYQGSNRLGFDDGYLDDYLRGDANPATSEKIAIPALQKEQRAILSPTAQCAPNPSQPNQHAPTQCDPKPCAPRQYAPNQCASTVPKNSCVQSRERAPASIGCSETLDAASPRQPETHFHLKPEPGLTSEEPSKTSDADDKSPPIPYICDCGPGSAEAWPEDENPFNTTSCGVAEDLINQYNSRGVDINVLKQKLSPGFRKGIVSGGGFRVQNHILFEILDDISGNMP